MTKRLSMKKRLSDVEGDLGKFFSGKISEEQYLHPSEEVADIRGEAECRADIVTRGQGNRGSLRVLSVLLAYYGPTIYKEITPQLGEGAEIFEKFADYLREKKKLNTGRTHTLFDYMKETFDIDPPSSE